MGHVRRGKGREAAQVGEKKKENKTASAVTLSKPCPCVLVCVNHCSVCPLFLFCLSPFFYTAAFFARILCYYHDECEVQYSLADVKREFFCRLFLVLVRSSAVLLFLPLSFVDGTTLTILSGKGKQKVLSSSPASQDKLLLHFLVFLSFFFTAAVRNFSVCRLRPPPSKMLRP